MQFKIYKNWKSIRWHLHKKQNPPKLYPSNQRGSIKSSTSMEIHFHLNSEKTSFEDNPKCGPKIKSKVKVKRFKIIIFKDTCFMPITNSLNFEKNFTNKLQAPTSQCDVTARHNPILKQWPLPHKPWYVVSNQYLTSLVLEVSSWSTRPYATSFQ